MSLQTISKNIHARLFLEDGHAKVTTMADLASLLEDLAAEGDDLDALVGPLDDDTWAMATPAESWTIAHHVAHLAWTDELSLLSIEDEAEFLRRLEAAMADPESAATLVDDGAAEGAAEPPAELLQRWRASRSALVNALASVTPGRKLVWFGPPMSAASMATARIMETWAHGLDVADALGVARPATQRLRNVAHLGVRARDFAYFVNGQEPSQQEIRVELTAPDGSVWSWGDEQAAQRVTGPALDFCLLVTRRRHPDDLSVTAVGDDAQAWLGIAQAFAGPPGQGRASTAGSAAGSTATGSTATGSTATGSAAAGSTSADAVGGEG